MNNIKIIILIIFYRTL